jgi:glycerophosphoryl diester phosphodiesterase
MTVQPERIAHRGSPLERVENTLPGFLLAIERGADAIELDVHVTGDGEVVVHHDADYGGRAIAETPWPDLSGVDLGGGMPRLADVLDVVGDKVTMYIELKGARIEEAVIAVARQHGVRFALHSFDHDAIARVRKRAPDIACGVLLDRETPHAADALRHAVERTRPRDVWPYWELIDEPFMSVARELDLRVIAWTVNALETAQSLKSLGVHGVCTDDVRLLANL